MCDEKSAEAHILEAAKSVTENLLPDKSCEQYKAVYDHFVAWQKKQNIKSLNEETFLVYFESLTKIYKPSSIWSKYSMIKSTVFNFHRVDIGQYKQLSAFLSKNSKGFKSKKSKILDPQHVEQFLKEAPDNKYLAIKVALVLGITGACRREELKNMTIEDVNHQKDMAVITIPKTKNDVPRKFVVDGEFYEIVKKYEALRPKNPVSKNFFLCLRDGKCTQQPIGINTLGAMPKVIAEYLNLEEPEKYTGHAFRRTSATMLADSGADLLTLKRHGGWKSDQVAMGYIEDSVSSKKKICDRITDSVNLKKQSTPSVTVNENVSASTAQDSHTVREKENASDLMNVMQKEKIYLNLNNCNVTLNFTKQ